ncbi:MAG: 2-oxoglutarate and iron-dependent oxygenase domain-containing protein [Saprospiraceae bacterium]
MSKRAIPVVELSIFLEGSSAQRNGFVKEIGNAFHNIGFVGVSKHGISQDLINDFYMSSKSFFGLPKKQKNEYEILGLAGQRGYTSFGKEHAKGSDDADLKEFFQFGQEISPENPLKSEYPENIDVTQVPQFTKKGKELYKAFEDVGSHLLRAIALHLDLDENYFTKKITDGLSILRTIHYPPITQEPENAIRAEQHEDINLITLLVGASAGGLQLFNMENEWQDIVPEGDEIVINVGDMLQRLTNNYLKSTTHRVINPPKEEWHIPRLSIPFFLHPKGDMDLSCLDICVTDSNPLQYKPITAAGYLDQRLREIGLKK